LFFFTFFHLEGAFIQRDYKIWGL